MDTIFIYYESDTSVILFFADTSCVRRQLEKTNIAPPLRDSWVPYYNVVEVGRKGDRVIDADDTGDELILGCGQKTGCLSGSATYAELS